ncbi:MAG: protein translocase subunit SecF [Actinomycetota bacterium]|nr:protein translocase subunit SecF [Actinomycetota bacterium]
MSRLGSLGHKLYSGEVSYDIVGKRRRWYAVSAVLVLISLLSLATRGLNLGIEFTGGAEYQVSSTSCTIDQARTAVEETGVQPSSVTALGNEIIRVTTEEVDNAQSLAIRTSLAETCGVGAEEVSVQFVGPTWGEEITQKAITALLVFLGLLSVFLALYFDWRMAIAALVALVHDILLTIGVYSLLQFEVTPATLIGILTILGYSLYDTVVVFDKVKENTRGVLGQSRQTYSQAANLAVNQTLVRSINTSIVALLPVGAILFVGAGLLGAGTLKDLALALFVGIAAGTYSSVFIATPLLAQLMERSPQMQALAKRVQSRGSGAKGTTAAATAAAPAAGSASAASGSGSPGAGEADQASESEETMDRARARRAASGPRNQPKRQSRADRH